MSGTLNSALRGGIGALAGVGAAIRRDRLFHPAGVVFDATFTVHPRSHLGVPLFDRPASYRAVVRLSKAVSTPRGWPDVLGLAVRVFEAGHDGAPLDLALATTGRAVGVRHVLVPRRDFATATFTSLLPYRIGGDLRMIAAMPEGAHREVGTNLGAPPEELGRWPLSLTVLLAGFTSSWQPVAALALDAPVDADPSFDVVANTVAGIAPAGWLNRLRGPAYRASQRARARARD